ncbi:uncharacterized protein B0J16DRAFT_396331 [Fusarium flagelliforme]|uniref:uncharacterized protein n=1 Tax=Fusarium flagelliforme TaxID=2675880 RepID=UPI001E8EDC1B|nr:uncharacterized protein B0J16DRAFT_396331 [Fusarium flagelliforme]KAH7188115.1 hypothetical protein B0J16DRAFT_396331 [Fusarium flagelliforme]
MVVTRSGKSTTGVIAKVPPEILSCIFQYFCSHCCNEYKWPFGPRPGFLEAQNTRALFNLCLVSRSFRIEAQKTLFHSFNPDFPPPEACPTNPWTLRLEPFLQTVAARPDLARSVKAVFLVRYLWEALDFHQSRKAFHDCVRALGKRPLDIFCRVYKNPITPVKRAFFMGPLPLRGNDVWRSVTPRPSSEEYYPELFSALVAILPNLTHLAILSELAWQRPRLWDVLPGILDVLGVECIPIKTIEMEYPAKNLLSRCTKLETWITDGLQNFPNMPTVKHLHLRHTPRPMRVDYSKCINACSGSLTTLSSFDATTNLLSAIDRPRLHDSLEVLHLNSNYIIPLPSLKMFKKLKYIYLDPHGIYGMYDDSQSPPFHESLVEVLPRNIVNLSVRTCVHTKSCWQRDLYEALASEENWFPELQSVTSNTEISHEHLTELFDRLGLEWVCKKPTGYYMNSSYYSS